MGDVNRTGDIGLYVLVFDTPKTSPSDLLFWKSEGQGMDFFLLFDSSAVSDCLIKVVDRESNQLRQVKEAIRIRQPQHLMKRDQGAYNLSNIYRHLFTTSNQSSGKQSMSRDVTKLMSQSDDGSRWDPKQSQ